MFTRRLNHLALLVFAAVVIAAGPTYLLAQEPALWGNLQPGPHAVGFRTVEQFDYSRAFRPKYNYDGVLQQGERARPIQICLWYPAQKTADAMPMVYGEYSFPVPEDERFYEVLSQLQNRETGVLRFVLGNDPGIVADLMNVEMTTVRNGAPLDGPFPLIVYHPHSAAGISENLVLCEYLASHGYVVATTHSMGMAALNAEENTPDVEALLRDKEFVLAYASHLPFVDRDRLGVAGFALGGLTALLMQMRNTDVDAVVGIDAPFLYPNYFPLALDNPHFAAPRMQVPLLSLCGGGEEEQPEFTLVDSLIYSPRYSGMFGGLPPMSFTVYGIVALAVADTTGPPPEVIRAGHETMCWYVLNFFDAHLKKDEQGLQFINNSPADNGIDAELLSYDTQPGAEIPPTQAQFMQLLRDGHVERAHEIYEKIKASQPDYNPLPEATLNVLGYRFLQSNRVADAMILFKMNTEAYPNSANVWDSYADALKAQGEFEQAITCYKKVLETLPRDTVATPELRQQLRTLAEDNLEALDK